MKHFIAAVLLSFFCIGLFAGTGDDIVPAFQRAAAGGHLRAVFIGGSITQSGNGWIGDWLEKTFPKGIVAVYNAGMSATGSGLGVFRVERDVMMHQPDIVFIEYVVNDGGQSDEMTIRFLETMVVRLKKMENPPAIVFVEVAAKYELKRTRHALVASHYGLLNIDLHTALNSYLEKSKEPWNKLMGDAVHPNKAGNEFYGKVIAEKLQPFADRALRSPDLNAAAPKTKLPASLSKKPLLMDAGMQTFPLAKGWRKSQVMGAWWDMFMLGTVASQKGGAEMHVPFRGTTVGIMFGMNRKYGSFLYSIDGAPPQIIWTNTRGGYASKILSDSLEPGEHVLSIITTEGKPEVHLAYLLTAGDLGLKGVTTPKKKLSARFKTEYITQDKLEWAGPYGTEFICVNEPTPALDTVYPPERGDKNVEWKRFAGKDGYVDFAALTGFKDRGVSYLRTVLESDSDKEIQFGIGIDYYGKLWINGTLVREFRGVYSPNQPMFFPVKLKKGSNQILFKMHSGSAGNACSLLTMSIENNAK